MRGLPGKVAIVTGATSREGIGFVTATRLCEEGAHVVLTDCDGEAVASRATELMAEGYSVLALEQDVGTEKTAGGRSSMRRSPRSAVSISL